MSIDASAKNMQAVCKAKEQHDKTCPWGGTGTEVHLNWFDIERMGWEEGDVICGLDRRRRREGLDRDDARHLRRRGGRRRARRRRWRSSRRSRPSASCCRRRRAQDARGLRADLRARARTRARTARASRCAAQRLTSRPRRLQAQLDAAVVDDDVGAVDGLVARALELLRQPQHGRAAGEQLLVALAAERLELARAPGEPLRW